MIGIIGAMNPEVAALRDRMTNVEELKIAGMVFLKGHLGKAKVVLLQCGIGKVNAAVGCALLLQNFRPKAIINTGSAGGLLASQTFGDVVISSSVLHHDVDVTAFGYAPGQLPGGPARYAADAALIESTSTSLQRLKESGVLPTSLGYTTGVIGSGDVFVHQPEVLARLRSTFPDLCAVEMESAAIAQTCELFHVPWVIIRALSDIAGKESPMNFDEFLPLASRHSCALVLDLVNEL